MALFESFHSTLSALGAMALLMFVQTLVADFAGLRARHIPGAAIPADHDNYFFRVSRAAGNTNETIAIFVLGVLFCILGGASAQYTAVAAWAFVAARGLYALCYYFNLRLLRSIMFGAALLSLLALIVIGFRA